MKLRNRRRVAATAVATGVLLTLLAESGSSQAAPVASAHNAVGGVPSQKQWATYVPSPADSGPLGILLPGDHGWGDPKEHSHLHDSELPDGHLDGDPTWHLDDEHHHEHNPSGDHLIPFQQGFFQGFLNAYSVNRSFQPYTNQGCQPTNSIGIPNSVYGQPSGIGYGASPYGVSPYGASPYGVSPYGAAPFGASPYGASPYGVSPYGASPYGASPYGASPYGASPYGVSPYGATPYTGVAPVPGVGAVPGAAVAPGVAPYPGVTPYGATPYTGVSPYGASPYGASPYGVSPYGASPYGASPYGASPYGIGGIGGYGGIGGIGGIGGTYGPGVSQAIIACPITPTQPTAIGVGYPQQGIVAPFQAPVAQPPMVCRAPATGGTYTCAPGAAPTGQAAPATTPTPAAAAPAQVQQAPPAQAQQAPPAGGAITPGGRGLPGGQGFGPGAQQAPSAMKPAGKGHAKKIFLMLLLLVVLGSCVGFLVLRARVRRGNV
jgi:hypothetical protein